MSRINHTIFQFTSPMAGQMRLDLTFPTPASIPDRFVFDDAAISALLTAPQRASLINLLGIFFNRVENDARALIDARRNALNTDP